MIVDASALVSSSLLEHSVALEFRRVELRYSKRFLQYSFNSSKQYGLFLENTFFEATSPSETKSGSDRSDVNRDYFRVKI